jgi:signal transduction histidine kinase
VIGFWIDHMSRRHREAPSRFSQAGGGPGSGLGLAIAVRVMRNHGGQLIILPSSRGATIKLRLPLLEILSSARRGGRKCRAQTL